MHKYGVVVAAAAAGKGGGGQADEEPTQPERQRRATRATLSALPSYTYTAHARCTATLPQMVSLPGGGTYLVVGQAG